MKVLKYIRLLLLPFSIIYGLVITIRNHLFDMGKLQAKEFDIPIISVGNITVGGTGKTPLTEFIIKTLQSQYQVALLSRGYKRKTQGVLVATEDSTALEIGDEPKQIKDKFKDLLVVVAEKRVDGIEKICSLNQTPDVVVMDDAYQHRYVKPGLSILVMDYNRPLWKDFMLPAGEMREPLRGKDRADIILVSKCPPAIEMTKQEYITKKLNLSTDQSVYFSTIGYQKPISLFCNQIYSDADVLLTADVLLVTGIANPSLLKEYVKGKASSISTLYFPDHYQFKKDDISKIEARFNRIESNSKIIITTEKDAVRFKQVMSGKEMIASYMWYLPIEIEILNQQQNILIEKFTTYVRQNKRKC